MKIVLLSGGSGKRLWPLSNEIRSKVFLKLLPIDGGGQESMMQRICRQLDEAGLLRSAFIVAHEDQVGIVQRHAGERIPIIREPHKKGTFTAVMLAVSYLHSVLRTDPEETLVFLPVDAFVETDFFRLLLQFPDVLTQSRANLALVGVSPSAPSNQYGYIVPHRSKQRAYATVAEFVEKPDARLAARLIERNALWNCGVFGFALKHMVAYANRLGLPTRFENLLQLYGDLPERSFDTEVAEKTKHAVVIPYRGMWRDLGTWETLTKQMRGRIVGPGSITGHSADTHLVNELPCPVQVIDVSGVVVAASPDGILVANKQSADLIKDQLRFSCNKPMQEEQQWGSSRILDRTSAFQGKKATTRKLHLLPGKHTSYQRHQNRSKLWIVLSGSGWYVLEDKLHPVQTGGFVQIPAMAKHALMADTPMALIEIQFGTGQTEGDAETFPLPLDWQEDRGAIDERSRAD